MSTSKTSGKTSSQQTGTQSASGSATPNNLPALQHGWNIADQLVGATAPQGTALTSSGLDLTGVGANATSGAAVGGLNQALAFGAPGGTTNGANGYLTPFADGSMSGQNPGFQSVLDQFARGAQAATDGSFGASGRYGSGANANAFNSAVANKAGDLTYQNYGDSLARQLAAGQQLSTNNANSTGQSISALDLIHGLGGAATGAGAVATQAGTTPALTFAQILQALGAGGGTTSQTGTTSATGSGKSSSTSMGLDLGSFFGGGSNSPASGLFKLFG